MDREYKDCKTLGGHSFRVKAWLTGGEKRSIVNALIDGTSIDVNDPTKFAINGATLNKSQDITLSNIVVDLDGSGENILQRILDLKSADFDEIVKEVNAIVSAIGEQELKKN